MLLTTEALITEIPEDKKEVAIHMVVEWAAVWVACKACTNTYA